MTRMLHAQSSNSLIDPDRSDWMVSPFFFFNDTATTEIYTLSLHDALPILHTRPARQRGDKPAVFVPEEVLEYRSEEHTSELQSLTNLVCRLLLGKKERLSRPARQATRCGGNPDCPAAAYG